ncbi:signal peptidase II [Jatrophihabitans cynanchi]|uniref:Lipoprotein signal peptidase n=1 Tax=Jatrophihabitans cynanchi TaxID=2944128 RepID=A0ABY7JZP4_9ACTN|nr:signal peptidase II [Jatrophihabitans sp. SB3-54]WAX56812.1 signal peptidase II [Jatrophihabitans sp. SB3-54]
MSTPERAETQREPVPDRPQQPRPRRIGVFLAVALVALVLDVVSKVLVVGQLSGEAPKRTLGGLVYLDLARNSGAAFSLGTGFTVILTAVAAAVVVIILRTASRMRSVGWAVSLGLILGGALGNLADRIFRAPGVGRGHVVDWISVFGPNGEHWPIFNIADSAICCGAVLAAVLALRGIDLDGGAGARD